MPMCMDQAQWLESRMAKQETQTETCNTKQNKNKTDHGPVREE